MLPRRVHVALVSAVSAAALLVLGAPPGSATPPAGAALMVTTTATPRMTPRVPQGTDLTSAVERARVDAVATPTLRWHRCAAPSDQSYSVEPTYGCTTVALPLDYDHPRGPAIEVALLKVPATDPAHRIGSLFLNPGGPGGSGRSIAARAAEFLSPSVRARFDLIGMDPRGTNDSTRLRCYPDAAAQAHDTDVLDTVFPVGAREEAVYGRAAAHLATTCSTAGRPLAASMSTAEVARDLDVLRRAVGDRQLSFLGWSYGTYLGQIYASLFPDRVRVVAIDGVVDAAAWRGTAGDPRPLTVRLDSARGSSRALTTLLRRCRLAGAPSCPLMPDPQAAFDRVAESLRARPVTVTDDDGTTVEITYAGFLHDILLALYLPEVTQDVPAAVAAVQDLIDADAHTGAVSTAARRGAAAGYLRLLARTDAPAPTNNAYELNAAVACSDSHNPDGSRGGLRSPPVRTGGRRTSGGSGCGRQRSARAGRLGTRTRTPALSTVGPPTRCWWSATPMTRRRATSRPWRWLAASPAAGC